MLEYTGCSNNFNTGSNHADAKCEICRYEIFAIQVNVKYLLKELEVSFGSGTSVRIRYLFRSNGSNLIQERPHSDCNFFLFIFVFSSL